MRQKVILLILCSFSLMASHAQEFSAGFRAGLNFSTFDAPSETDADGGNLEEYKLGSGFHVGGMANLKFTDEFGLRGELLYSQKGVAYNYTGLSFWVLPTVDGGQLIATGDRATVLSITNSYIDIPIMAVGRFGRIEVSGGFSTGFLVSSRGSGELKFSGNTSDGSTVAPFTVALDFNYLQGREDVGEVELRDIAGKTVEIPKTLGAYYEELENSERLFNTLDVGLIGGVAFFVNEGLFMGLRVNYGLSDITKTDRDFSRQSLDEDNNYIPQEDTDRNLVLQASVGFSF
jgi:hypothetical protein